MYHFFMETETGRQQFGTPGPQSETFRLLKEAVRPKQFELNLCILWGAFLVDGSSVIQRYVTCAAFVLIFMSCKYVFVVV